MGSKVTGVTGLCFLLSWFSYVSGFRWGLIYEVLVQ